MDILFAFENELPSRQADAEVFVSTARALAPRLGRSWLHVPGPRAGARDALSGADAPRVVRAWAPRRPAILRHVCCAATLPLRRAFRRADLVYTRNLLVASVAIAFRKRVAFDHYRPWSDQIPPLRPLLHRLHASPRFLVDICHSDYTRASYLRLGVAAEKLVTIRNGFDPDRLGPPVPREEAARALGLDPAIPTVVYAGRLNHKKGLDLVLAAARRLPGHRFLLVGGTGEGPIEAEAATIPNVRVVGWLRPAALARHLRAADILLIPPSTAPLARHGSTVLPLKVFLYLASGRPIVAGNTADLREVLHHGENAWLCPPDDPDALCAAIATLDADPALRGRLGEAARRSGAGLTWDARAGRIADVLERRAAAQASPPPRRGAARRGGAGRDSLAWAARLLATRSWVSPPPVPPGAERPQD